MFKLCITSDLGFEYWQDIPEYEGLYQGSTYGRIKGVKRGKILKPFIDKGGYLYIILSKDNEPKICSVHRAVSKTFLPKWKPEYTQINHKDENPQNNRVENLEWCTSQYNINYGNRNSKVSKKMTNGKLSKSVLQYNLQGTLIKNFPSIREVERETGYANTHISACCNGKSKTAYGYVWKYA